MKSKVIGNRVRDSKLTIGTLSSLLSTGVTDFAAVDFNM